MGNTPGSKVVPFASSISNTFSKHKDVEHSQSTTAVQFQRDLRKHQQEEEEYVYLTKLTTFDSHTLRLLKRRFDTIDQTIQKDGKISIEEFANALQMKSSSLLLGRFFKYMDKSSIGALNFRNFATALSTLSLDAADEDKIKLSFFLYDLNDDGHIDRTECTEMVKLALDEINMTLSEKEIEVIVNNTFREADLNRDGEIDYQEYKIYCQKNPRVLEPFRVDIASLVLDEQENRRGRKMSGSKLLRHWPGEQKKKNKMLRKIKKSVPSYMKREKIEKVRSIHNAQDIIDDNPYWNNMEDDEDDGSSDDDEDDGDDDEEEDDEELDAQPVKHGHVKENTLSSLSKEVSKQRAKEQKKQRKKKKKKKKQQHAASKSIDLVEDEGSSEPDDDDVNKRAKKLPKSPGSLNDLKVALSADSAARRKMKTTKYASSKKGGKRSKSKGKGKKEKQKQPKKKKKQSKEQTKSDNDENKSEKSKEDEFAGLNTTVPRTPPQTKEKPAIEQAELDAIERLLSD